MAVLFGGRNTLVSLGSAPRRRWEAHLESIACEQLLHRPASNALTAEVRMHGDFVEVDDVALVAFLAKGFATGRVQLGAKTELRVEDGTRKVRVFLRAYGGASAYQGT